MEDSIISLRINKETYKKMRKFNEVNWSSILRNTINNELSKLDEFDYKKAEKSFLRTQKIRKKKIFDKGEEGTKIIRKWRNKRK